MRTKLATVAAAGVLTLGGLAACTDDKADGGGSRGGSGAAKVGVILPDTSTSQRWGSDDPKLLKAALRPARVAGDIRNPQGKADEFVRIADDMVKGGAKVLMIASLDAVSGKTVL